MLKGARGEWSSALADFAGARDLHRAIPNPYGVLLQTYRMGEASAKTGDLDAARLLLSEAYAGFVAQGREADRARRSPSPVSCIASAGRTSP